MKNTKVNEPIAILNFLKRYKNFAIIGHEEPDGDCLSSQLALKSFLKRLSKEAVCYSPGPFLRPEVRDLEGEFSKESVEAADAAIVVDCSTLDRIGRYSDDIKALPTSVIDHHSAGIPFGDVRYIDPGAPSVTFQILKVFDAAGLNPNLGEAELLFFGLCTDTGFFRHLGRDSKAVFAASERLVSAGASPKETFARMFGNRSYDSRKLLGRLLERAEQKFSGRLLITWESTEELEEFGKHLRDSDALYQQLQVVRGCDIVVLVRQESKEACSVGLRSSGDVDVGEIARDFGGGGHSGAAGFNYPGLAFNVARDIVEHFKSVLK